MESANFANPMIRAEQLGLETRRGWVYRDLSFTATAGNVTTILGPTGSGKTALLLTLAGRMSPTRGSATMCGLDLKRDARQVRNRVGLGLIPGVNDLDDALTAEQHITERLLFIGDHRTSTRDALTRVGLAGFEKARVKELDVEQRERLGVGLGLLGNPEALVIDDIDHDLDSGQQRSLLTLLRGVAGDGLIVVGACIDARTAKLGDTVVTITDPTAAPAKGVAYAVA